MAELDNIPQRQNVEIEVAKLDEEVYKQLQELNQKSALLTNDFGQIYIRKRAIEDESKRLEEILENAENDYKATQKQISDIFDQLDEKYPQGRVNLQNGTIQYQPGAPTRKQLAQQQSGFGNQ